MNKMSEVFKLPLSSEFDQVTDKDGESLASFNTCKEDDAAIHAINSHDALTERVKVLEEFIGMDSEFPLTDIINILLGAADELLDNKNYDGDGWEVINEARISGKASLKALKAGE